MSIQRVFRSRKGRRYLLGLFLCLLALQFLRSNVGTFSIVDGLSMYPTFRPNDVVQAKTLYTEVQRGDVVIVTDNQGEEVIKRIVGLPGETLTLYRGFVFINRQQLDEPYLPKFTYTYKPNQLDESAARWHLNDDQYFVLGDNRLYSADSRLYGPVGRHQILRVVTSPPNAARPRFSNIWLSSSGHVFRGIGDEHTAAPSHASGAPASTAHK